MRSGRRGRAQNRITFVLNSENGCDQTCNHDVNKHAQGWFVPDGAAEFRLFEVVERDGMAAFLHCMSDKGLVG